MPALALRPALAALLLTAALPALADGLAGPYLAGRVASGNSDYAAAADYLGRSLIADPTNPDLQENTLLAELGLGRFDKALAIAEAMGAAGKKGGLADLTVLATTARSGDFAGALAALDDGRTAGPVVDGFLRAWAELGNGQMSEATASFDKLIAAKDLTNFALYHKALALALVGDFEGADAILSGKAAGAITATRRSVIAHAQILSQLERDKEAVELIDKTFGARSGDGRIEALRADLQAGKTVPFDLVRSATDGLAEVFLAVGSAVGSSAAQDDAAATTDTLLYARAAQFLRPDLSDAALLVAATLEAQGQEDLAIAAYGAIPAESSDHVAAELGRAQALLATDKTDAGIEVLQQLTRTAPDNGAIWVALGDTLRRNQRFDEAANAYDKALALVSGPEKSAWGLYYARGICLERLKQWDRAEPDFRKALQLSPDQPQVLNYLGYSYLEKNTNLDEALSMIDRAAKARPDDGAISDSLGWGYYRLGRYAEAEKEMERAIQLMAADPVVNDHLGDVYWAVGRKREAEFQWKRALSFKPDTEEEANRIRRKLEVGLDAVLKEEGAPPLSVTAHGG